MALEVLGLVLWLVFAGAGAWLLVTGRNVIFGLPLSPNDVRLRRLFGLLCILVAAFFIFRMSQGSYSPESIIGLYAGIGFAALFGWWKRRDARTMGGGR